MRQPRIKRLLTNHYTTLKRSLLMIELAPTSFFLAMAPVRLRPTTPQRCIPTVRQRRQWKAEDELCDLLVCLVAIKRLRASRRKDPVVRDRISWRVHATTLLRESAFKKYYRMSIATFEELLCIVGPYLVMDYYQSLRRSRGVPPLTPAAMLQCALSWLAGEATTTFVSSPASALRPLPCCISRHVRD